MKVRDLIYPTLRLVGALASGETPSSADAEDAKAALNSMLGLWSIDGLVIYAITTEDFPLVASQQSYTIGTGGNFNTTRPIKILNAGLVDGGIEQPIEIINNQQWAAIQAKTTTSSSPSKLYLETSFPLAIIKLWPGPDVVKTLRLYSMKPLTEFVNLTDEVNLPPGYAELIKYNLYLRLAPEYGKQIDPSIEARAIEAKIAVERQSSRELLTSTGLTEFVPHSYNIYSGGAD